MDPCMTSQLDRLHPHNLRAVRCDWVLEEYGPGEPLMQNLVGLLTDAMHWCRLHGHDFALVLRAAEQCFQAEVGDEGASTTRSS